MDTYRPVVEMLEARRLLAGDVTATVDGNVLTILGDSANNDIDIDQDGLTNSQFRVEGDDDNNTTVNGSSAPQIFSGIRHVVIKMFGGRDDVDLDIDDDADRLVVRGNLKIGMGGGNDELDIGDDVRIRGRLTVDGKSGRDDIDLENAIVDGVAIIRGGSGDDFIDIDDNVFNDDATIRGKEGDDFIVIRRNNTFRGERTVGGGLGNDVLTDDDDDFDDLDSLNSLERLIA